MLLTSVPRLAMVPLPKDRDRRGGRSMRGVIGTGHVIIAFIMSSPSCGRLPLARNAPLPQGLAVGQPAPDLEGQDLDGVPLKLSDYRGKVVVVVFSGHW